MRKKLLLILVLALLVLPVFVFAEGSNSTPDKILVGLPNVPGTQPLDSGPAGMIYNIYIIALWLGGILAFGSILFGGIQYLSARGSTEAISSAKNRLQNAILGLLLLVGIYVLLGVINPDLTNLRLPTLQRLEEPKKVSDSTTGGNFYGCVTPAVQNATKEEDKKVACFADSTCANACDSKYCQKVPATQCSDTTLGCSIPALTELSGPALQMENGTKVIWTSDNDGIQQNLSKLQEEFIKLQKAVQEKGGNATVNSAYRPYLYQKHLWEIINRWVTKGLQGNNDVACASLKTKVEAEYTKHGLGTIVSEPSCNAPHVRGTGLDIQLTGYDYSKVNALLSSKHIDLRWQGLTGDPVHFNLLNAPFDLCVNQ